MAKNGYLEKKNAVSLALVEAGIRCGKQQMVDYITCVLRNPVYMGTDTFGRKRIDKVLIGLLHYDKKYAPAYSLDKEADVAQAHLDEELRLVYGDELVPFEERQPDILQPGYAKSRKGWKD